MNKVMLVGRLAQDPLVKTTTSNIKYAKFTLAVSRTYGENLVDYIPVSAWRKTADFVENYFRKGMRVSVEGSFTSSKMEGQNGMPTRYFYEVTSDRVEILESKAEVALRSQGASGNTYNQNEISPKSNEIPFEKENKSDVSELDDVPWELDL